MTQFSFSVLAISVCASLFLPDRWFMLVGLVVAAVCVVGLVVMVFMLEREMKEFRAWKAAGGAHRVGGQAGGKPGKQRAG